MLEKFILFIFSQLAFETILFTFIIYFNFYTTAIRCKFRDDINFTLIKFIFNKKIYKIPSNTLEYVKLISLERSGNCTKLRRR